MRETLLLALLAALPLTSHAEDTFPERRTLEVNGYSIEFSVGDESYANSLARHLESSSWRAPRSSTADEYGIEDLARERSQVIADVAELLALDAPNELMLMTYDNFLRLYSNLWSAMSQERPRRFSLWRRPELAARLDANERIAGFHKNSDGEVMFEVSADFSIHPDTGSEQLQADAKNVWRDVVWPIRIASDPAVPVDADIAAGLAQLQEYLQMLIGEQSAPVRRAMVMMVLHETVEVSIVNRYIQSADRRWFCEGTANLVSLKVLERRLGAAAARSYYDPDAEAQKHVHLISRSDLENWPVAESPESALLPPEVNAANYAFATKAIAAAVAKHGEGILPKLFKEISKTASSDTTLSTVYAAFRALTREDLRSYWIAHN